MKSLWKKLSREEIHERVFTALKKNVNFKEQLIMGVPGSHLDPEVFYQQEAFLRDAPYLTTLIRNPNHIGCHTFGESEEFTKGTQDIEIEVIDICAKEIMSGGDEDFDGYIASGGTESNIQALWVYRNLFEADYNATKDEIAIICSADGHYSVDKGANLLGIQIHRVDVDERSRRIEKSALEKTISDCKNDGVKYIVVVANMMTTMYGSVDSIDDYADVLNNHGLEFKIHVDAAFGGFFYPFSGAETKIDFSDPRISSITLDAHKMVQSPYGTGIFLARKNLIQYANTKASYVEGDDFTLIGSRSGANAIAIWMILMTYGRFGWEEKIMILQKRAGWFVKKLSEAGITANCYNHSNIITIDSKSVSREIAKKFGLIPDDHHNPFVFKIVVMDHVTIDKLALLLDDLVEFNLTLTQS